jgi:hypothetical protein
MTELTRNTRKIVTLLAVLIINVTMSGCIETTINTDVGEVIHNVRAMTPKAATGVGGSTDGNTVDRLVSGLSFPLGDPVRSSRTTARAVNITPVGTGLFNTIAGVATDEMRTVDLSMVGLMYSKYVGGTWQE